ncbi:MAG: RagB/SusD family nutrient uptake outer membrane protein [Saprospiraceae bacterium]|nr:RagB/SusD family nutrient uptake outer membrane protein [Saprospiraceae bacterium]MDP4701418.1 RagB/SusD family nutrient uptake outer membrane protein [Saprospiraceae bacterium]MDP4813168.1 RagB/SusD family nutrient uptake outer membrane protein [Saprospiraceae bacterium]MDP4913996.1 RagB/SusD family nutrient uptake outer membrane protein [Saprospiraceae bacterium]MDP5048284.1 RagB/SusD family nutrient uptake outer membrane protein [Saprospiraceae bacterium]
MKKIIFGLLSLVVFGCNDDFVNTKPLDQLGESTVWTDASLAEAFVSEIYAGFGNGGFDEQMNASLTDETIFTHPGRNITTITESRSNPANPGWINGTLSWGNMYLRIRACNLALSNLEAPKFTNPVLVDRMKGEVKFLRAYYYHQLIRYFGGVPIIDKPFTLNDSDFLSPRNTWEECVNFIVKNCDEAAALLDGKSMVAGRANKAAALALKARVLIYAASDLHDMPTAKSKSSVLSSFEKPELVGYVSGDRKARWEKARDAAKAVLDLPGYGYALNLTNPVSSADGTTNYMNASLAKNGGEKEILIGRYFINAKQEGGGRQGLFNGPNGYHNWAGNTPVQLMIDDYEMMDGSKFDWNKTEHSSAPYTGRDPRFYASVLFEGAPWKPRTSDVASKDPANQIQTGQYILANGTTVFGLDTRKSSVEDWNGSYTGYYIRKFVDPNPAIIDQNTWQQIPWPILRYTEMVFNYAEALIELGDHANALLWLNKVRFRAGMPALTETGDALKQRFRNEKRVEMYLEEQRYHDTRRWMIAPTTLGRKANGINVTGVAKAGATIPNPYRFDPNAFSYTYKVFEIDPGKENRAWLDKMYYLPIHRDEMNRNNKLVQNPGY